MVAVSSRRPNTVRALLPTLVLTIIVACVVSAPAQAYQQLYGCSSCASVNGAEFNTSVEGGYGMRNAGGNESGKGLCSAVWENLGGGKWQEYGACSATETFVEVHILGYFNGHGQVRRYYKEYLYHLSGREEN